MKKLLLIVSALMLTISTQAFAAETPADNTVKPNAEFTKPCDKALRPPVAKKDVENFEKKLKLTEEQKAKAKQIHQKGYEAIKPVVDKINLKREEIEAVKRSRMSVEAQAEKISELRKEIRDLKKQARTIQMENMKEFEAILTTKQKAILKKIKEEGRKNFQKKHKKGFMPMPPKETNSEK